MSLLQSGFADDYLDKYRLGQIGQGKGIGIPELDKHIRFKEGQFVIINGLENVGKTVWMMWYYYCLSIQHGLKWVIWSGENKAEQLVRTMIEFRNGQKLKYLEPKTIQNTKAEVLEYFKFVDNRNFYTNQDLYKVFKEAKADGALIDPFTGLNRGYTHKDNYDFLNETRAFINGEGITCYVNTHPNTEATRRIYPLEHEYFGYRKPPLQSEVEGGQPFANRTDDFMTLHRLVGHPDRGNELWVFVRKVKDVETGGEPTSIESPIIFDWNKGCGFVCYGQNPLSKIVHEHRKSVNLPQDEESDLPF